MLDDYTTAPIDEKLRAMLGYLDKMTTAPSSLTAADARALLDAGLTRAAIEEALCVGFAFNVYDRMADGLNFKLQLSEAEVQSSVKTLLGRGYK